jgi:hypothetical protein
MEKFLVKIRSIRLANDHDGLIDGSRLPINPSLEEIPLWGIKAGR